MGKTHFSGPVYAGGNELTANPKQVAIADLTGTTTITGSDSVSAATVLAAIQALEGKVNAILAALRAANIINV